MTPMLVVFAVILAGLVLLALAYPIIRSARGQSVVPAEMTAEETYEELVAERDAAFQAIRDLQFDHDVGKITDGDLTMYEADMKQRAAGSLRHIDTVEAGLDRDLSSLVEAEVAARRRALRQGARACPSCGQAVAAGDEFCTHCGSRVGPAPRPVAVTAARACPSCGSAVAQDDRFCPKCGQSLGKVPQTITPKHA